MRNGIILQVQGLGVPVHVASNRVEAGYELRWSSDPDCSVDAPAHILFGNKELERFLSLAVEPRFLQGDLIKIVPVEVADDQTIMTKAGCLELGINPDNWSMVRVAMVIAGNIEKGSVTDTLEWVGTREDYANGEPMREAMQHAKLRGMRVPTFFSPHECGHLLRAAEFMQNFRRQMKPSLRLAELMQERCVQSILKSDFTEIHGERAAHYLRQVQDALRQCQEQRLNELEDLGLDDALLLKSAQDTLDSRNARSDLENKPARRGPSFH